MRVEATGKIMHVVLTLEEAVLLKRVAWDGPDPSDAEQLVLDRLLNGIEKAQETARKRGLK